MQAFGFPLWPFVRKVHFVAAEKCHVVTAKKLARHIRTVIQEAFILAKSQEEGIAAQSAREQIQRLRRYLELLFNHGGEE